MQTPYRKPGKYSLIKPDPLLTKGKIVELENKLNRLKKKRPEAAGEVGRLSELGDFSENVEYQLAKGRLRGINQGILNIEKQLNQAIIITPQKQTNTVQVGHHVTIETDNKTCLSPACPVGRAGKQKTYQILGSSETNPQKGIISYLSPLGSALIGKKVGEIVKVRMMDKEAQYKIIKIE